MLLRRLYRSIISRSAHIMQRNRTLSERFTVRQLQTAEEVGAIICARSAALGSRPGALDHFSFFAADPTGFFVGELDGKVISSVSAVKYSHEYAFFGHYIVDTLYRRKGYGLATYKAALISLPKRCNFAGDVVQHRVKLYESHYGYKSAWRNQRVSVVSSNASSILSALKNTPGIKIEPVSMSEFDDLLAYDTSIHVHPRSAFLKRWLFSPNCYSYAAKNANGYVVGYAVVRTARRKEDGWKIGPLFADNSQIARMLYKAVCNIVTGRDPTGKITIDVPFGDVPNPDAHRIIEELSASVEGASMRMYSNSIPSNIPLHKVFGVTTLELG